MAVDGGEIRWFSPDPRGIIPLDDFHLPHRLQRLWKRGTFAIEINQDFEGVIRACAEVERDPLDPGTWISNEIIDSYLELHSLGYAHSVEVWRDSRQVAGLYGVALGGAFFGESMFHREANTSKIALVALVDRLQTRGYRLLDTQWATDHLRQFGAIEIPRRDYLRALEAALAVDCVFA
jgi:leucyl/phenylalanyl-tRNA---protein transferase